MIGIVKEGLDRAQCPSTANFIELGGNSLQAVRIAHRMTRRLGIQVHPADLLHADSIGTLAVALASRGSPT